MKQIRLAVAFFTLLLSSMPMLAQSVNVDVIAKAEKYVSTFLDQFSEVKCTESVQQERLSKSGKVDFDVRSRFDYLLIAQNNGGDLDLNESRFEEQSAKPKKNVSLLVTNGFATQLLVFHPYYESGFAFAPPEYDVLNGLPVAKVRFRHVRGMRTPTALYLRGREYPLEMMGTAWIERSTGVVLRIDSELQSSMEDVGLRTLLSSVTYAPVFFRGIKEPSWLPSEAVIEVATPRQHWRNVHRFTNYQRFDVDTTYQDKVPDTLKGGK